MMSTSTRERAALRGITEVGFVLALGLIASAAQAEFDQILFRAADGTAYQVLRATDLATGADKVRVTTVAGSPAGTGTCEASGDMAGEPASAIGGTSVAMILHPYALVSRTFVLAPNDISALSFDESGGGVVRLGSGAGALRVCASILDCAADPNVQPLVELASNLGDVPQACIAANLAAACDGPNRRAAFAFGLAATGMPPLCNDVAQVTVNSSVCASQPADGFDLALGHAIVFVYGGSLQTSAFEIAAGGFAITTDGVDPLGCSANTIVGATGRADSEPPIPTPTTTPIVEPTRPAIPVIASPISPAGLGLVIALGAGLLFAARRVR